MYCLPRSKLLMIFKSLSFSKINYSIEVYGKKNNKWMMKLQKCQNRLLKILLNKSTLYRTNKLHKDNKILKVHDHAKLRLSLLCHKSIYYDDNIKNITTRDIKLSQTTHSRTLRNNMNVITNTLFYNNKNRVIEEACVIWNELNNDLKSVKNRKKFKENVENDFLKQYI